MKILALDTSTIMTTCAVLNENQVLGEYSLNQDMSHSEKLVPMVKEVLDSLDLKIEDIDLYGVTKGPGSFTGLRIGVATVKTFAHLFDRPIVGISTLEALAFNLPYNEIIVPMIDARRNRVYTGVYSWKGNKLETLMEPNVIEIDELLDYLNNTYNQIIVNGNGSFLYKDKISGILRDKVRFSTISHNSCQATSVGELALIKYKDGYMDNYYTLVPEYLRESQAQRELKEKEQR